ncbi:MAG: hypothetical protein JJU29_13380 [Verrucomicrobia bacterium]|nr:hypothetical protein [Verrucomicrobiota bacterium]MCH8512714.1 hypothetical protein [Kiritimatiellia bacterium]
MKNCLRILLVLGFSLRAFAQTTVVLNPYAEVDWDTVVVHKANLHTHTTESDGVLSPQEVVKLYAEAGYTIFSITDHDTNEPDAPTWPWEAYGIDVAASGMLPIQGNEISRPDHIGSYFNDYGDGSQRDVDAALKEIGDRDGLAVLFHPGRYARRRTTADYVGFYRNHPHLVGMEVFNQNDRYPGDRATYDAVLTRLMPERPVWAMANDDFHRMEHFARSFNLFLLPADGLNETDFRAAFEAGRFHAVHNPSRDTGQVLIPRRIEVTETEIRVEVDAEADRVIWISEGHEMHRGQVLPLSTNLGTYVRAHLQGEAGTQTLLQPFGLVSDPPARRTVLAVEGGGGSGAYLTGSRGVALKAGAPPEGHVFARWTGDVDLVEDVNAAETVIHLTEEGPVSVTAETRPAVAYTLEVISGQGGGEVPEESVREIVADIPEGMAFHRWEGDVEALGTVWSPTTRVRMPDRPVRVMARFQPEPVYSPALVNGDFSEGLTGWDAKKEDVRFVENEDGSVHLALQRFSGIMQRLEALEVSRGDILTLSFEAKLERPGTHVAFVGMQLLSKENEEMQSESLTMDIDDWRPHALRIEVAPNGPLTPNLFLWMRSGQMHVRGFRLSVESR